MTDPRHSFWPVLRCADPVMFCDEVVGSLRTFDYRNETTFDFTPNLAGVQKGFVYRESESFPRLWSLIRPTFYQGRRNWAAGVSGGNR